MEPVVCEKDRNFRRSVEFIETAADNAARLIVLPELANSGHVFETREEAFDLAEPVPGGPTCDAWIEAAAKRKICLVAGIAERVDGARYNSAVVIGPDGYIGTF